jgi:hypothetical protein
MREGPGTESFSVTPPARFQWPGPNDVSLLVNRWSEHSPGALLSTSLDRLRRLGALAFDGDRSLDPARVAGPIDRAHGDGGADGQTLLECRRETAPRIRVETEP